MWQTIRLGDVCTISSSKRIFAKEYQTEGIPFYRGKEVIEKHNGNKVSTELFISPKRYEEIKGKYEVPKKGDILLTSVGTLGIPWLVDEDDFYFKDGNLTWLRCNTQILPSYLYLWLNSAEAQNQIDVKCIGSTQKALTIETLNKFQITLPSLELQKKIVAVINPIESRININRSVNENLEQQLAALFSHIFADDISKASINTCPMLGDLINVIDNRGKTPPLTTDTIEYPIIDVGALKGAGRIVDFNNCTKYVNKATYETWFRSGHPKSLDILLSTVGSLAELKIYLGTRGCIAQNVVALRATSISPLYLYQYLRFIRADLVAYNIGSVQPSIKVTHIIKHPIFVPETSILETFEETAKAITEQLYANYNENESLKELRDALLPKLMSGEIDISKFQL